MPTWQEQRVQFLIRYLFLALAWLFFNGVVEAPLAWVPLPALNALLAGYCLYNTANFIHAWYVPHSVTRYRVAMWVDILTLTVAVLNDPHEAPPTVVVYVMIVLGNGMRYGMRLFAEAVIGCLGAAMVALSLRYSAAIDTLSAGVLFLNLFGAIILIYSDILMARVEDSRAQLEAKSREDALTGLMNRAALTEFTDRLFRNLELTKAPTTVMFADLDKFKAINDTHGHAAGDRVLAQFADILRRVTRESDLVARYGGDEFVMVLPDTPLEYAERAATRIQTAVREWCACNGLEYSVSIGLAEAPTHGGDLDTVLANVDQALYRSKAQAQHNGLERAGELVSLDRGALA